LKAQLLRPDGTVAAAAAHTYRQGTVSPPNLPGAMEQNPVESKT
jgi:hypothetical protein